MAATVTRAEAGTSTGPWRVAFYLRRSSKGEENKNYSIDNQRDDCATWADVGGHEKVAEYVDPGGRSYSLNRRALQQMYLGAKAGQFDVVVVGMWDRLSRDQDQAPQIVEQLRQYGVTVLSATQPTSAGSVGKLERSLHIFSSEQELENLRKRTQQGRRKKAAKGELLPGPFPKFGWVYGDARKTHYREDPETAETVRYIYRLLFDGLRVRAICRRLEEEGVETYSMILARRGQLPKGKPVSKVWSAGTVKRILSDPAYCGNHATYRYAATVIDDETDPLTGELLPEKVVVRMRTPDEPEYRALDSSACPPLVTREMWEAAQQVLRRNGQDSPRNTKEPAKVLLRGGFAVCGYCGRTMTPVWKAERGAYVYRCSGPYNRQPCDGGAFSWRADELDRAVWGWVIAAFEHPEVIRAKFEQWRAERVEGRTVEQDRVRVLDGLIEKAERRARNCRLNSMDAEDEQDRAEWRRMAEEQEAFLRDWRPEREKLARKLDVRAKQAEAVESLVEAGTRVVEQLREAEHDERRAVLRVFQVKATVRRHDGSADEIDIEWAFDELHEACVAQRFAFPTACI